MIRQTMSATPLVAVLATVFIHPAPLRPAMASNVEDVVIRVNHLAATELVAAINRLLADERNAAEQTADGGEKASGAERTGAVAEVLSNSLLIRADAGTIRRIKKLVEELDQQPQTIFVEVTLVAVLSAEEPSRVVVQSDDRGTADNIIQALAKQGELKVLARTQLTALNNQPAQLRIGQRVPRVTGTGSNGQGAIRQVSVRDVGLTLAFTPRVSGEDTVTMEIDWEKSGIGSETTMISESSATGTAADGRQGVGTISLSTTVCVRNAQTIVLGGLTERQGNQWRRLLMLLTTQIVGLE